MRINKILSIVSGVMLLLAIPSMWPYGYYQLLRWVVSIVGISNAYQTYKLNSKGWAITMVVIAILFNPIEPLIFSKGTWILFDLATAFIMFTMSSKFKNEVIKN
ncbi:MAG TPA: DUF6804 family protein [Candidatus Paceibacterota bacterium]